MNLAQREAALVEMFEWIDDATERYELIIDMGKSLPNLDSKYKSDEYEVKGCQSKVWLTTSIVDNSLRIEADSNTVITKGIVAILIYLWSGLPKDVVANASTDILDKIGLRSHLTSQRNNGLLAMIHLIKSKAI